MALAFHARRQTVQRPLLPSFEHIWISDDILASLLHQFTLSRISKRHGSSVPGPLEAKRRLAKRRMMNIAVTGGAATVDAGLITGMAGGAVQKDWRWEPPMLPQIYSLKGASTKEQKTPLPPWLTDLESSQIDICTIRTAQSSAVGESTSENIARTGVKDSPKDKGLVEIRKGDAVERASNVTQEEIARLEHGRRLVNVLEKCHNLQDIRKASAQLDIVLGQDPSYSRAAFKRLLELTPSLSVIQAFLDDPSMNARGARNLRALLQSSIHRHGDYDMRFFGDWIQRHVYLGMLSEVDLKALLRVRFYEQLSKRLHWSIPQKVWEGLRSSQVLRAEDLQKDMTSVLLQSALQSVSFDEGRSLGLTIVEALQPSQLKQIIPTLSAFLEYLFLARYSQTCHALDKLEPLTAIGELDDTLLNSLPKDIALQCIAQTTARLIKNIQLRYIGETQEAESMLEAWFSALSNSPLFRDLRRTSDWYDVEHRLATLDAKAISAYLRFCGNRRRRFFIVRHWVFPEIQRRSVEITHAAQIRYLLERSCQEHEVDHVESCLNIVRVVKREPSLLRSLMTRLVPLLHCLKQSEVILQLIKYARHSGSSKYVDHTVVAREICRETKLDPVLAMKLFVSEPRVRLDDCPELASSIIAHPALNSNSTLRFLLMRGRDMSLSYEERRNNVPALSPTTISTLHEVAWAFAGAPHLRPRQAFRGVVYCYHCLLRSKSSMGPEMSQALTEAGVIRYLRAGQWVSSRKLSWILFVVKELEGAEVAEKLDEVVYAWRGEVVKEHKRLRKREKASKHVIVRYRSPYPTEDVLRQDTKPDP